MDIKERLRTLDINPISEVRLDDSLSKLWQSNIKIKLHIKFKILDILKEIYEPMGLWTQNPTEKTEDIGVIYNGKWDELMQADTNYSGHSIIFNRCNLFIYNLYRKKGIESIEIGGEIFTYKEPIIFYKNDSDVDTIKKIDRIFKIIEYKKEEIFLIGNPFCEELRSLFRKFMELGDKAQHFYEKHIHEFFDDIVNYESTKGRGDKRDRTEGIDVWKTHTSRKSTDQIKGTCKITPLEDGYLVNVAMSKNSKCDYYVFVCGEEKIMIFDNIKEKLTFTDNGVIFPNELLYKEKNYNE
jgi:hypothetical protein